MLPGDATCLAGATYERDWESREPDPERARREILDKIRPFFPAVDKMELITCRAGLRAFTPQHRPLIQRMTKRLWVYSGLGSKGLIYHSYFAKRLVQGLVDL